MTKCKAILRAILMGITFSIFSPLCVSAQEKESEKPLRPVTSVFTVELGRQSALDTYLTPIRYWGLDVALGYERLRAVSFAPEKWFTRHNVSGSFASMTNQSGSGSMLSFYLDYSFAMLRRWQLLDGLYVSGGGEAALTLGGLYNLRNSNNPATAKAAIDLGATAMASYHFYISRLPVTLRYQVSLPVIGTFFSPEFGQSYYEMFSTGMIGQYAHGNEPGHHVIYLYNRVKQPWKTQQYAAQVMHTLYKNTPDGICGNEDCGQMSSWYVFSAMGFYPVDPISGQYEIGSPIFPEVKMYLANGKTFVVRAENVSDENIYIQSVTVNGQPYNKSYITHEMIMQGDTIHFVMGNKPGPVWYE